MLTVFTNYRLKKLRTLEAVSRSMILAKSAELRGEKESRFRTFKEEVLKKEELKLKWQEHTKEKFAKGASEKQQSAQLKERKRLDLLESLHELGGPFTNADQVETYLKQKDDTGSEKERQKRLKKEIQFARESSTTLPSNDPIFKIQLTLPNGKRRDKTSVEFAESLMLFLGKKSDSAVLDYNVFKSSLRKFSVDSDSNNN